MTKQLERHISQDEKEIKKQIERYRKLEKNNADAQITQLKLYWINKLHKLTQTAMPQEY